MRAMEDLGSLVGRQAGDDAQAQSPEHQQGATEHSGGRVRIAGEWYDTDKITGGRDEPDRVDRAAAVEADGDMEDLRQLHDEVDQEIRAEGQSTARGRAYKSTHDSADTHQEGRQMVLDTNWDTTEQAFSDAHVGMIGEDTFPQCETTRTVIPGEKEVSVTDQEVCEKVVLAAGDQDARSLLASATNDEIAAAWAALLGLDPAETAARVTATFESCSGETAVPAIAGIARSLAPHVRGSTLIEVPHPDDVQGLRAPPGLMVVWLPRNGAPPEATADTPGTAPALDAAKDGEATQWLADHFFGHIRVRGYTQFRFNQPTSNPQLVNLQGDKSMGGSGQFFIRRARIALYGDIHPLIYIYLQPDFASATDSGLHFVQMRDWYADLAVPGKELRLRVGQSKVPYGFENMQSSQNRLPLDRSDPINSALVNERDLGAFLYWAPRHIRQRLSDLTRKGLKGSGDYGVAALGVFNGQTNNRPDLNSNKHVVARVSYPFLFGQQYLEIGGGGYYGKYVVRKDDGITGPDEFHDARGHLALVLYPQPFGLQIEYNAGIGPELSNLQATTTDQDTVYSGEVREQFLHGGYALLSYKVDHQRLGTIIPYARGMLYEGGKKHETNAPSYSVRELEVGLEWQPIRALEFVSAFTAAERTAATPPYQQESGFLARFQLQINY